MGVGGREQWERRRVRSANSSETKGKPVCGDLRPGSWGAPPPRASSSYSSSSSVFFHVLAAPRAHPSSGRTYVVGPSPPGASAPGGPGAAPTRAGFAPARGSDRVSPSRRGRRGPTAEEMGTRDLGFGECREQANIRARPRGVRKAAEFVSGGSDRGAYCERLRATLSIGSRTRTTADSGHTSSPGSPEIARARRPSGRGAGRG